MHLAKDTLEALKEKLAGRVVVTKPRLTPEQRQQLVQDFANDPDMTVAAVARKYGISGPSAHYLITKAAGGSE